MNAEPGSRIQHGNIPAFQMAVYAAALAIHQIMKHGGIQIRLNQEDEQRRRRAGSADDQKAPHYQFIPDPEQEKEKSCGQYRNIAGTGPGENQHQERDHQPGDTFQAGFLQQEPENIEDQDGGITIGIIKGSAVPDGH